MSNELGIIILHLFIAFGITYILCDVFFFLSFLFFIFYLCFYATLPRVAFFGKIVAEIPSPACWILEGFDSPYVNLCALVVVSLDILNNRLQSSSIALLLPS
jgi:hypothetical protein